MLGILCVECTHAPATLQSVPASNRVTYDADLRPDLVNATLDVHTRLTFLTDSATTHRVRLFLNSGLQIDSLTGPAVESYRATPSESSDWQLIEVQLAPGVLPGQTLTLALHYAGTPRFSGDTINGMSADWLELSLDSQWHPVFASFDREMTGRVRVMLPQGWRIVASGETRRTDGQILVDNRIPQNDVALTASAMLHEIQGHGFSVFSTAPDSASAGRVLGAAEDCASYLNPRFGRHDPLPQGKIVLAPRGGPGYARKNYIVLSHVAQYDAVALHYFVCHELAHYWTRSAGSSSPHHWMLEAFAEYEAARYLRDRVSQAAFDQRRAQWDQMGRGRGPVWTPESTNRPSFFVMYRRAPYLLSELEERIGTPTFDRFAEGYMAGQVRTTPQLLALLEVIAGPEAREWFAGQLAQR
jgi:hypothetical protein